MAKRTVSKNQLKREHAQRLKRQKDLRFRLLIGATVAFGLLSITPTVLTLWGVIILDDPILCYLPSIVLLIGAGILTYIALKYKQVKDEYTKYCDVHSLNKLELLER